MGWRCLSATFFKGMTMRHPFVLALYAGLLSCSLAWGQAVGESGTAKDSPQVSPLVTTQEATHALPPEPLQPTVHWSLRLAPCFLRAIAPCSLQWWARSL